jgi:ferritin-like metal-binding protein YciE
MKLNNLNDLFVDQIRDLYNAERQIEKALPKMVSSASSPDLQQGFQTHLEQTKHQVDRLTQIFEELKLRPTGKACQGMEGIISEGEEFIKEKGIDPAVKDAALIASAQRVEHYEIAGYGTARTYAQKLGYTQAARLLEQTLQEERQTDEKLTQLAESGINQQAKQA